MLRGIVKSGQVRCQIAGDVRGLLLRWLTRCSWAWPLAVSCDGFYVRAGIRRSTARTSSASPTVMTRYRNATTLYVSKKRNVLAE